MLRWANRAADDARASEDRSALGHAYFLIDLGYASIGAPERGSFARRALEIFEQLGDHVGLSRSLNNLGISAWRSGDWGESLDLFDRSRRAYERSGDVVGAAMAANNAAEILSDQGRLDEAIAMYRGALSTCKSARYPSGAAVLTGNLGQAEARAGRHVEGLRLLDESIALLNKLGAAGYELEAAVKKTEALVLAGRFDEALDGSWQLPIRLDAKEEDAPRCFRQRACAGTVPAWLTMRCARSTIDRSGRDRRGGLRVGSLWSPRRHHARRRSLKSPTTSSADVRLLKRLGAVSNR
jgi:tetratricopeptide (TPR) repeat protein